MRRSITGLLLIAISLTPARSQANAPRSEDGSDPVARARQAGNMARMGQYEEAVVIWIEILNDLPPDHSTMVLFNLGLAFKKLGRFIEAHHYLSLYPMDGPDAETARDVLQRVRASLETTRSLVDFVGTPMGALLRLADDPSASTHVCPVRLWLEPGEHEFNVSFPGFTDSSIRVVVENAGQEQGVQISLTRETPPAPPPVERPPAARPTWAWATLGGGLALAATGTVMFGVAYARDKALYSQFKDKTTCDECVKYRKQLNGQVIPMRTAAYVLWGVGAAATGAGAAGLLWPREGPQTKGTKGPVALVPMSETPLGLGVWWSF